jgi:hypothetical protein
MTPSEIYTLPSEEETCNLLSLDESAFDGIYLLDCYWLNEKIIIKTVAKVHIDHRRYVSVKTIWFNDKPFMIHLRGGRSGCDAVKSLITDEKTYKEAHSYLLELILQNLSVETVDADSECEDLNVFYTVNLKELLKKD